MFDFESIKTLLSRTDEHEALSTPTDEEAKFVLEYDDLSVGHLWLRRGTWHYEYAEEFKQQSEIEPIVDFPDPAKRYEAEVLWPFFVLRIPSTEQPNVKKVLREEQIDEGNEAQMLRRFGRKTIANPFYLQPA